MTFYISKIIWFFLRPSSAMLFLLLAGTVMLWSRWARTGRRVVLAAALLLLATGFTPLGHALILPLEQRFPRADLARGLPPEGIIVLGGSQDMSMVASRGAITINEAGERLVEAALLAKAFPDAKILLTGRSNRFFGAKVSEAAGAAELLSRLGVEPERFILETNSKNTFQNALYSAKLVEPKGNARWLLITSANHMPRAMGAFRTVGFDVEPWPVDYRTRGARDLWRFFVKPSEGWRRVDVAMREWAGLLAYWVTGRTDTFFPGPR